MRSVVPSRFAALSTDALTSFPLAPSQADPTGEVLDGGVFLPGSGSFAPRALDHVLARGLGGSCEVQRVDGGGGMDHRAQVCSVEVPAAVAPRPRLTRRGCTLRVRFAREDVRAVRIGGRVDRSAPFTGRLRSRRVRIRPLTLAGPGPVLARRVALPPGGCG